MYRSLLFTPATRPDRFEKAIASGADVVCLDLEDAVPLNDKDAARASAIRYLEEKKTPHPVGVRINAVDTDEGQRDLDALSRKQAPFEFVMAPKVSSSRDIDQVRTAITQNAGGIWALIETPNAIYNIREIATAVGANGGLLLGGADLSASLGSDTSWDAMCYARGTMVMGAAPIGCNIMDMPWLGVDALDRMTKETERARAMGFTGRACIHPSQVGPVNEVFTPSDDAVAEAKNMLNAYKRAGGVLLYKGKPKSQS